MAEARLGAVADRLDALLQASTGSGIGKDGADLESTTRRIETLSLALENASHSSDPHGRLRAIVARLVALAQANGSSQISLPPPSADLSLLVAFVEQCAAELSSSSSPAASKIEAASQPNKIETAPVTKAVSAPAAKAESAPKAAEKAPAAASTTASQKAVESKPKAAENVKAAAPAKEAPSAAPAASSAPAPEQFAVAEEEASQSCKCTIQ